MTRNFIITGIVSAIMGGFVLAYQAVTPEAELPTMGEQSDQDRQPPDMADDQQIERQPMANRPVARPDGQMQQPRQQTFEPGPLMGQAQPPGMQMMQQMPMMGMCPMMGGMAGMGGQMNKGGTSMQGTADQAALLQELRQLRQEVERLKEEQQE